MATIKQKNAVNNIVDNGGNVSKAMLDAKYSKNTAKTPQKLTNSKGFKEICDEIGLTKSFITQCLIDDITDKPRNRQSELALASKMLGLLNDKLDITSNNQTITGFNFIKNKPQNGSVSDEKE